MTFQLFLIIILSFINPSHPQILDPFSMDPDKNALTHEFIASRGFNWQFYSVPTKDGYFVGVYRIVHPFMPATKTPVLFAGTDGGYSREFLRNNWGGSTYEPLDVVGPNIGFEVAKRGYDVWLLDWRGNFLDSYHHVKYTLSDKEYYDYSCDEKALFDLPAVIDFVRRVTGREKIAYVGLQDGARYFLMLSSMVPRFNRIVQPVILLSPMWSLANETNPVVKAVYSLAMRALILARGPVSPGMALHNAIVSTCNLIITQRLVCNPALYLASFAGLQGVPGSVNYDRLSVYTFDLISSQTSWISAQLQGFAVDSRIRMLDISPDVNQQRYGGHPLEFMPERITNPDIHVFQSRTQREYTVDSFAGFKRRVGTRFRSENIIPASKAWSALSFLDGTPEDVARYVNEPVLRILDSYNR